MNFFLKQLLTFFFQFKAVSVVLEVKEIDLPLNSGSVSLIFFLMGCSELSCFLFSFVTVKNIFHCCIKVLLFIVCHWVSFVLQFL